MIKISLLTLKQWRLQCNALRTTACKRPLAFCPDYGKKEEKS